MKKVLFSMLVVLFAVTTVNAKGKSIGTNDKLFGKGAKVLNIGLGVPYYSGVLIPPIIAALDVCIIDNVFDDKSSIGVGGTVGLWGQRWGGGYSSTYLYGAARGSFHYQFVPKLDVYGGIALGFVGGFGTGGVAGTIHAYSPFYHSEFVGARFYFSPKMAVFTELGYSVNSFASAGISFKF